MRRTRLVAIVVALAMLSTACQGSWWLLTTPTDGQLVDTATVEATGVFDLAWLATTTGTLTVAGIPTTIQPDGTWSQTVPVNTTALTTEIEALYDYVIIANGEPAEWRQSHTVVYTASKVDFGEYSGDGVGLYFANSGLAALGPVIEEMAGGAFDIEPILTSGGPILNTSFELLLGITLDVTGTVYEAGFDSIGLTTTSTASGMATNVTISDLYLGLDLNIETFGTCKLEIEIPTTTIQGLFDLEPAPGDPSTVDVNMIGNPNVTTTGVGWTFISGVCDPDTFLIGSLVSSIAGAEIDSAIDGAFVSAVGDPDGNGPLDSPIADAIETALADISIAGAVAEALGVNLDAPLASITETAAGLDLRSDADFWTSIGTGPTDCTPPPGTAAVPSTVDLPGAYPTLGTLSPGGDPFGIGLVISASAFNQLLGSMTECGLINVELSEIDLGAGPVPITTDLLSALIPELATAPWPGLGEPLTIKISTTAAAPFLSADPGPNGEMGELNLANLLVEVLWEVPDGSGLKLPVVGIAMDAPLGFDLAYDAVNAELAPTIAVPDPSDITARVVWNQIGANSVALETLFPQIFPVFASGLTDTFAAFPLPGFLGLDFSVVEVGRVGNYFVLYGNLDTQLSTRLENVQLTNLSSANYEEDDSLSDSSMWRSDIRKTTSSTSINAHLRAGIAADSISFFDQSQSSQGAYRLNFNVVPENGETWNVNVAHNLAGAHTHIGEGGGDATTNFLLPGVNNGLRVTGRTRIGTGAWQYFSFNPSDFSENSSGGRNTAFTGSNSTNLVGTTAQSITVEYYLQLEARSECGGFLCGGDGDEAAIRLGLNDTLANGFTAGEYAFPSGHSSWSRVAGNDGHFGNVTLTVL